MPFIYIATSKGLEKWASDVGLTKHVYKIGLAVENSEAAIAALNESSFARESDWRLLGEAKAEEKNEGDELDEASILGHVAAKEKQIDANYYPRLKGTIGLFKVKPANVESHLLLRQALAGEQPKIVKAKNKDIAAYLLALAAGKV